jgi:alpha-tubulin suppressor-like RCC1 family protein
MTGLTQVWDTTSLVAGVAHTCALTRPAAAGAGGAAFCWGANGFGQLGAGSAAVRSAVPLAVTLPTGVTGFTKLFAGEYHTCGVANTGTAYCWGRNSSGQLGDGTTGNRSAPVAVTGGLVFRSLATGELHTCGVVGNPTTGGTQAGAGVLYCWGDNEYGQLGSGTTGTNGVPVLVPTRVAGQP